MSPINYLIDYRQTHVFRAGVWVLEKGQGERVGKIENKISFSWIRG